MSKILSKEVLHFLNQSSTIVGKWKADDFNIDNWNIITDNPIDSPIEQILYLAFETMREINRKSPSEPIIYEGKEIVVGLGLHPQRTIEKYRVDFVAVYGRIYKKIYEYEEVIIECDSQQFHERTEKERRYEKKRDRYLQKKGYKIFHYTGKEIFEQPYQVVSEIIGHLIHADAEELILMLKEWL